MASKSFTLFTFACKSFQFSYELREVAFAVYIVQGNLSNLFQKQAQVFEEWKLSKKNGPNSCKPQQKQHMLDNALELFSTNDPLYKSNLFVACKHFILAFI